MAESKAPAAEQPATAVAGSGSDVKLTLHWLNASRSHRILWLLEELNLPYTLKTYDRQPTMLAPPDLRGVHPLGKSPVLTVEVPGAEKPLVIAESGVIVEYLLDHWGHDLLPKHWKDGQEGKVAGETEEWMRYRYYMHYAEGSLMSLLLVGLILSGLRSSRVPWFVRPISSSIASRVEDAFLEKDIINHWRFLNEQLATSSGKFLAGDKLTGADIMMVFPLEAREGFYELTREKNPKLLEYRDMLQARDAYKRATKRAEQDGGKVKNED